MREVRAGRPSVFAPYSSELVAVAINLVDAENSRVPQMSTLLWTVGQLGQVLGQGRVKTGLA
jgi:hypothetical protein